MKKILILVTFLNFLGCDGKKKSLVPSSDGSDINNNEPDKPSSLKNFIVSERINLESGFELGSGVNHFFAYNEQPRSFATCLDSRAKTLTPSSNLNAKLYLRTGSQSSHNFEKNHEEIKKTISANAKYKFVSMDINDVAKTIKNIINDTKIDSSSVEIVFDATRKFSRVSLENLSLKQDVMTNIELDPEAFYKRCGTGAAISLLKEVKFKAKASCKKSDRFASYDFLNELQSTLDVKMAEKDLFEIGGAFGITSNISHVLKTLNKHGINECYWEMESTGLSTIHGSIGLIDTESLIRTAQAGLDLVMQAKYEEASIVDVEIQPYSKLPTPKEYQDFFERFNSEVEESEITICYLQKHVDNTIDYLTTIGKSIGLDTQNENIMNHIKNVKLNSNKILLKKLNPVSNQKQ